MKTSCRICFIGIGSIAKRHIRNLRQIACEDGFSLTIDAVRHQPSTDIPDGVDNVFHDFDKIGKYDAIFITNPTEFHLDTLNRVRDKATAFFIEKPIASARQLTIAERDALADAPFCYAACPLRYKKVIQQLREIITEHTVRGVRCLCSSYLPDWRPNQDYRETYSAQKVLGGGVSTDLIHEWDYLRFLFGMPNNVFALMGKKSALEIDTEDTALYVAEYTDKFLELHLDYFGRHTIRECMLFTDDDTIVADLVNNRITFLKENRTMEFAEERDDFQKSELRHFLQIMEGTPSDSTIREAVQTTRLTQGMID